MYISKKSQAAIEFVKGNKQFIIEQLASDEICPPSTNPIAIFMAGSPGAGKTEFSKNYLAISGKKAVRVDADDVRELIPEYTGKNSDTVQGAAALGVEKLFDYALKNKKDLILDATFVDGKKSLQNIARCLKKDRRVIVYYIYQDPLAAWEFTKARELQEGRRVPKIAFVRSFFKAHENVKKAKETFGAQVTISLIIKNYQTDELKILSDVSSEGIDKYCPLKYSKRALMKQL